MDSNPRPSPCKSDRTALARWLAAKRAWDHVEAFRLVHTHEVHDLADPIVNAVKNDAARRQGIDVVEDRTDAGRIDEAHVAHVDRDGSAARDGFSDRRVHERDRRDIEFSFEEEHPRTLGGDSEV